MDADTFVCRLAACAPSIDEGLSGKALQKAQSSVEEYVCRKRVGMDNPVSDDPIIDLVLRYHLGGVEIGLVSFRNSIEDISGKLWFGTAEADVLVVDQGSSRIQLLDHAALPYVMCDCASSGSQFLDALIAGIELGQEIDPFEEDSPPSVPRSLQCARIAGSDEFRPFYRGILGWGLDEDGE